MRIDVSLLPAYAATFMLIFARVGMMVMLVPGFGELTIPARIRLGVALVLAAVLLPLHREAYQIDLRAFGPLAAMLGQELLVGAMLGMAARLTMAALQVAGAVIAQQLGLGFVTAVDPSQGQQGALLGNFLSLLGVTLIFATDLHHLIIAGMNDSFRLFRPGELLSLINVFGDMAQLTSRVVADAFRIGIQLSAPFLVFGMLFNLGLGVLARLMPQMQVFFVGAPLSILIGFILLFVTVAAMMTTFLGLLEGVLRQISPFS